MEKQLNLALVVGDKRKLTKLLSSLDPGDLTEYLNNLPSAKLARLIRLVDFDRLAELLSRLSPQTSAELLAKVSREQAADVLQEMEPDEAADVLEQIPSPIKRRAFDKLSTKAQTEIGPLLRYGKETAGAIMTPRFVAVTKDATVDDALGVIRALADKLESLNYLYVLDHDDRLTGVLSLRALILAKSGAPVEKIMDKNVITAGVNEDQELAAHKVVANELAALPVVDGRKKLLGIITYDDAARVLEQETSEDIERIGGAQPLDRPYLETSLAMLVKKRVGWLFILFFAQILTGNVLAFFSGTLSQVVALSFFIPLLIGTGGNIGSQTVTMVVRALAVGHIDINNLLGIVWKEARTGILLGAILGFVGFIWAQVFTGESIIGITVGVSLLIISFFAASIGALIPLLLHRFKLDPATASTPFISTLVDASGLVIYFLIARTLLKL